MTCPYCDASFTLDESSIPHQLAEHPDEVRALSARLARYGRRRRAAERGEDWTKVE